MISLFEPVGPANEIPVDLVTPGGRGVSLLEFMTIEDEAQAALRSKEEEQTQAESVAQEKDSQLRIMVDAARAEAAAETRRLLEGELERRLLEERSKLQVLLMQFAENRASYFAEAEAQVVRLALSVACKVLHREVVADPMHLQATVRAALGRVSDGSSTVLRVRPEQVQAWTDVLNQSVEAKVSVLADYALAQGDCVLETSIGRVELGVATQLGEIEQRFRHMLTQPTTDVEMDDVAL